MNATAAFVVFSGETTIPWLRLLRPGFRHCFLVWCDGRRWLTYDPMAHRTHITAHDLAPCFDMASWYRAAGLIPMPCMFQEPPRRAAFPIFTCVAAVKHMLGIRRASIFTPWQLCQHLKET